MVARAAEAREAAGGREAWARVGEGVGGRVRQMGTFWEGRGGLLERVGMEGGPLVGVCCYSRCYFIMQTTVWVKERARRFKKLTGGCLNPNLIYPPPPSGVSHEFKRACTCLGAHLAKRGPVWIQMLGQSARSAFQEAVRGRCINPRLIYSPPPSAFSMNVSAGVAARAPI